MNDTAKRYKQKVEKLLKKAEDRMNPCELNFCRAWVKYSNFSLLQRRRVDAWLEKYELAGADPHNFKPFSKDMQSTGGFCITRLRQDGSKEDKPVLSDLTRRDAEVLYCALNDYGEDIRKALNRSS